MISTQKKVMEKFSIANEALENNGHSLYTPYQVDGVKWMIEREYDLEASGGILADEMGLGKTIQTISLILGNRVKKTLILVPPTLVGQWSEAIRTFAPSLKVWEWYGKSRIWKKEHLTKLEDVDVVITSYGLTYNKGRRSEEPTLLHELKWNRIVLDEGHMIVNKNAKRSRGVSRFMGDRKWVLTGTPVNNSENDYINLLAFIGVSFNDFSTKALRERFILRRTKEEVAEFNPNLKMTPLEVNIVPVEFASEEERVFYRRVNGEVKDDLERLRKFNFNLTTILELLMRLRQASVHPQMVINAYRKKEPLLELPNWFGKTSKIALLTQMVKKHPNETSLIFCQFKYEMNSIRKSLEKEGCVVKMINGSTKKHEREQILKESNTPSEWGRDLMLINGFSNLPKLTNDICLKVMSYIPQEVIITQVQSGGTGLNLQKCSRVYFTTLLWNPALESQCIARAHRIGQTRKVVVTKFSLRDSDEQSTIDDRILAIQEEKREIMSNCLQEDALKHNGDYSESQKVRLTMYDIIDLLK